MNLLVTAGGTTERIDPVRSITNTSTGALGARIAEAFAARSEVTRIFYVAPASAVRPTSDKIVFIKVSDTASVEAAVTALLTTEHIDIAIHSMAISDYRIRAVTTSELLGAELAESVGPALTAAVGLDSRSEPEPKTGGKSGENFRCAGAELDPVQAQPNLMQAESGAARAELFASIIRGTIGFDRSVKISSKVPDLVLIAEQTPKIIALFHKLSPATELVSFKLLNGVEHDQLIGVASALLTSSHARFVLANDLAEIDEANHIGYLVDASGEIARFPTKQEIASGLVTALLG